MIRLETDVRPVIDLIGVMLDRARNPLPIYADIQKWMIAETRKGFLTSTNPYGAKWAPITHRVGKPLLDTGRLFRSLTPSIDMTGASVGTKVFYAIFHQTGTSRIRQRAFFPTGQGGWPAEWARRAEASILQGLLK